MSQEKRRTVEILGRMLNERSGIWEVTPDRVSALSAAELFSLPAVHMLQLRQMVEEADKGGYRWSLTNERLKAIYAFSKSAAEPRQVDIRSVIDALKDGAVRAGVRNQPWIVDAIRVLEHYIDDSNSTTED